MESYFCKAPSVLKRFLQHGLSVPASLVVCNESGDLDSIVCSAVLASWMEATRTSGAAAPTAISVLNFPRQDLALRTEAMFSFKKLGLNLEQLTFRDDVARWEDYIDQVGQVILVDHNVINTPELKCLEPKVRQVLDHRRAECHRDELDLVKIEPVGSCATLIAEHVLHQASDALCANALHLLRGTILIDTVNLAPEYKKVTPKDVTVLEAIEKCLGLNAADREKVFKELSIAKADITGFTVCQLLRKDMKAVYTAKCSSLAMSTVPGLTCQQLVTRNNFEDHMKSFLQAGEYKMSVILAAEGGLLIYPAGEGDSNAANMVKEALVRENIAIVSTSLLQNSFCLVRTSKGYTRKKIMPIIQEALL